MAFHSVLVGALAFHATLRAPARVRPATMAMPWESGDKVDVKALAKIEDIKVGAGDEAVKGSKIAFDFSSRIVDGDELDSAKDVRFELGKVDVIPGWLEGLTGMRPGGERKVTLPEELWKNAQPNVIKSVPRGQGALIEFDFSMKEVAQKAPLEMIGIAPTKQNFYIGGLILLIGVYEGFLALTAGGADGDAMAGL